MEGACSSSDPDTTEFFSFITYFIYPLTLLPSVAAVGTAVLRDSGRVFYVIDKDAIVIVLERTAV